MKKMYIIAVLIVAIALVGGYLYFPLDVAQTQKNHSWALWDNPGGSHPNAQVFKMDHDQLGGITWYCVSPNNQNIEYKLSLADAGNPNWVPFWEHVGSLNVVGGGVPYPVVTSAVLDLSWTDTYTFTVELLEGDPNTKIAGADSNAYPDGDRWHKPSGGDWIQETNNDLAFHIFTSAGGSPPICDFDWEPNTPYEGQIVQFYDMSSDLDGDIATWQWDFGDGGSSTQANPTHTYLNAGTYTITLTVTDESGNSDDKTQSILVSQNPVQTYTLGFYVTDSSNSAPVVGATVSVNQGLGDQQTDSSGYAYYYSVEGGSYYYSVNKDGYQAYSSNFVLSGDNTINVALILDSDPPPQQNGSILTIVVEDKNGNLLKDAEVDIDSISYSASGTTDSNGIVYFENVPDGTYGIQVKYGSVEEQGTATIPGESIKTFALDLSGGGNGGFGISLMLLIGIIIMVAFVLLAMFIPMPYKVVSVAIGIILFVILLLLEMI